MPAEYFLSKSPHPTQKSNCPFLMENGVNLMRESCSSCFAIYIAETLTCDNTFFVASLMQRFCLVPVAGGKSRSGQTLGWDEAKAARQTSH